MTFTKAIQDTRYHIARGFDYGRFIDNMYIPFESPYRLMLFWRELKIGTDTPIFTDCTYRMNWNKPNK